jgi:hypothetical protein
MLEAGRDRCGRQKAGDDGPLREDDVARPAAGALAPRLWLEVVEDGIGPTATRADRYR